MKKTPNTDIAQLRGSATRPSKRKALSLSERFALGFAIGGSKEIVGRTIFGDRPLRLRTLTPSDVDVRLLDSATQVESAFKIRLAKAGVTRKAGVDTARRHGARGSRMPAPHRDPSMLTFLAYDEGKLVGTVGVRLEGGKGLPADRLYREDLDALRAQGHRICEFAHLAVDATTATKPVLASLFHSAYLYAARVSGFTHVVIEVHATHVRYYERALGFEPIGAERMNKRLMGPVVLLCGAFSSIADGIARYAGRPDAPGAKTSLLLHGFPPDVEEGVLNRLRTLARETR